jgi:hypothetical protein
MLVEEEEEEEEEEDEEEDEEEEEEEVEDEEEDEPSFLCCIVWCGERFLPGHASSANHSFSSLCCLKGSRLSRTLPLKRMGSCGMHVMRLRRSSRLIVPMSMPSNRV